MFLPVWIIFTLRIERKKNSFGKNYSLVLAVTAALFLLLGGKLALSNKTSTVIDKLSLASFNNNSSIDGTIPGFLFTIALCGFLVFLIMGRREGFQGEIKKFSVAVLSVLLLFNTVCAAVSLSVPITDGTTEDALELNSLLKDGETALGITQRAYNDFYTYWQEAHLSRPMQQVTEQNMFLEMERSNGTYQPFVPSIQSPNIENGLTPETNTLILGQTIRSHLELSPYVEEYTTHNGIFTVVTIQSDERWVDSMLGVLNEDNSLTGLEHNLFSSDTTGYLRFFDGLNEKNLLKMQLEIPNGGTVLNFNQDGTETEISIDSSGQMTLELPLTASVVTFTSTQDIEINSYVTEVSDNPTAVLYGTSQT